MTAKNDNLTNIELEVQRRVTDALSSAGVAHGRISLEVLYMMPPRLTRVYQRLFNQALEETVQGKSGRVGVGKRSVKRTGALRDTGKQRAGSPDRRRAVVQIGAGGGKRFHRGHWIVQDEEAMRIKGNMDRRLTRLAIWLEGELEGLANERRRHALTLGDLNGGSSAKELDETTEDDEVEYKCPGCGLTHTPFIRLWGRMQERGLADSQRTMRHCPGCGLDLG